MSDFNVKMGKGRQEDIIDGYVVGNRNRRSELLWEICQGNQLVLMTTARYRILIMHFLCT